MPPPVHHRDNCPACEAELVYLAGDPTVAYEDIDPSDGGPRSLVEHTTQRCEFHQFLTPAPGRHTLPGNANWPDKSLINTPRTVRWVRDDQER